MPEAAGAAGAAEAELLGAAGAAGAELMTGAAEEPAAGMVAEPAGA